MLSVVSQFFSEVLRLLGEMAPYLTLGFVLAGILHAYVPKQAVAKHLGGESVGSAVRAAVIGVPLPLCSCGVVPTGIGLRKRGASRAAVVSFLISTPQTGVDSIFATYGFFGWLFAIFRPIAAFVSGIVGGVATLLLKPNAADDAHWMQYHIHAEDAFESPNGAGAFVQKLNRGMRFAFFDLLGDISLWLVIGLALAAIIAMVIPNDFFAANVKSEFLQMLIMMAFGIPLYVCSTASIPIAAVLIMKGVSPGAAFVFLMTGPATNAATMLIIGRVMGWRVLALYLSSIAVLAIAFGLGLDYIVAHTGYSMGMVMDHQHAMAPNWLSWLTAGLLAFFMMWHFIDWITLRFAGGSKLDEKGLDIQVEGMNCTHCVHTVTDSLKKVPGVANVNVTLATGQAHVEGEGLSRDELARAIEGVGYKVKG
jgi:uncharacterized protein